ncbi:hypothetical protein [Halorubrum sp. ARQ200]|uniref:hypothetical protein n=1 Tax=Halorubrum sp. ARQ200 TaxID=1855872 RepID=UPI0010F7FE4D|nr:hypothetical protein [Halorubrum sp. ARQ200]TKX45824.1 hypothetical protein EXE50_01090 [Halorubrum sp. ARQ200]
MALRAVYGHIFGGGGKPTPTADEVNGDITALRSKQVLETNDREQQALEQLRFDYGIGGTAQPLETNAGAALWSAVEDSIARSRIDALPETEAVDRAQVAVDEQASITSWNVIDLWNSYFIDADRAEAIKASIEDHGVATPETGSFTTHGSSSGTADVSLIEPIVETSSGVYVWTEPLSEVTPAWLSLEGVEDQTGDTVEVADLYVVRYAVDGEVVDITDPSTSPPPLVSDHPDYAAETIVEPQIWQQMLDLLWTLRDDVTANLTSTVDSIYLRLDTGDLKPTDIMSAQTLLTEFDDGQGELSPSGAVAAMAARGYSMPEDFESAVTIAHPGVEGEITGWLFVDAAVDGLVATAGTTIQPDQYDGAQIVYFSEVDSSTETAMLSGEEPLEIVDYSGETSETVSYLPRPAGSSYNDDRIWFGDSELPDRFGVDMSDAIRITDESGTTAVMGAGNLSTSGFRADAPDAAAFELVFDPSLEDSDGFSVELVSGLTFDDRSQQFVSDPTDPAQTRKRLEGIEGAWGEIKVQIETIEGAGGGGGGGGGGGWGPVALLAGAAGALALLLGGGR